MCNFVVGAGLGAFVSLRVQNGALLGVAGRCIVCGVGVEEAWGCRRGCREDRLEVVSWESFAEHFQHCFRVLDLVVAAVVAAGIIVGSGGRLGWWLFGAGIRQRLMEFLSLNLYDLPFSVGGCLLSRQSNEGEKQSKQVRVWLTRIMLTSCPVQHSALHLD